MTSIGKKIRQLRRQCGLSQEDLAYELSITRQAVSKWESGLSQPTADNLMGLSDYFGIPLDELVNYTTEENKKKKKKPKSSDETAATDDKPKKKHTGLIIAVIALSVFIAIIGAVVGGIAIYINTHMEEDLHTSVSNNVVNWEGIVCLCTAGAAVIAIIVLIICFVVKRKKSK